ncbi:hypothetical protein, partial [Kitasatospora sp. NPDC047058]|uniref:hypothetical protein n=1 Tax=Kitasatospora sp. NPDC047058 TaxID=3155620 RepID=UPI0033EF5B7A
VTPPARARTATAETPSTTAVPAADWADFVFRSSADKFFHVGRDEIAKAVGSPAGQASVVQR